MIEFSRGVNISVVDSFYNREKETVEEHISYRKSLFNNQLMTIKANYKGTFVGDVLTSLYLYVIKQRESEEI